MNLDALERVRLFDEVRSASDELDADEHRLLALKEAGQWREFLELAVRTRRNILISGATGSGKTPLSKALIAAIPAHERLITIEDIVEEIVGEISDEHEDEEVTVVDVGNGAFLVSGLLRVEQLEEKLGADLRGEDYETVAGLIFTTLGRVPGVGTVVVKNGYRFEVDRADRRRIYRVKISPAAEPQSDDDEGAV